MEFIIKHLKAICEASVLLDLASIHGHMIGTLEAWEPGIFVQGVGSCGRTFWCSKVFVP